jgi:predicted nucleic acid-binding protein
LFLGYAALAQLVELATIEPVIKADPDDDSVLACAIAARANFIVIRHGLSWRNMRAVQS